jgi:hypothetical protein
MLNPNRSAAMQEKLVDGTFLDLSRFGVGNTRVLRFDVDTTSKRIVKKSDAVNIKKEKSVVEITAQKKAATKTLLFRTLAAFHEEVCVADRFTPCTTFLLSPPRFSVETVTV